MARPKPLPTLMALVALLLVISSAQAELLIPTNTATAFIQTSGPNAGIGVGDYRTSTVGDNLPHEIVFNVACTPSQQYTFQIFDPAIDTVFNAPCIGLDGVTACTLDEVRGAGMDNTTFTLLSPASATIANPTYAPNTSDGDWLTLATITLPAVPTPGVDCGQYLLRISTADDDDNAWRLRLFGGAAWPETFNPDFGPDGVDGTGDESWIGLQATSYQHEPGGCHIFYWFSPDGNTNMYMLNFDMDGGTSVTYTTPGGTAITGTLSIDSNWNSVPPQLARPGFANMATFNPPGDVAGDAIANPESGLWSATLCVGIQNQYSLEVPGQLVFLEQPRLPNVTIAKTDGVVNVTSPGTTTYTLTITNNGPGAAMPIPGPEVVDQLPVGMTFASCTVNAPLNGTCNHVGGGRVEVELQAQAGMFAYLPGTASAPNNSGTITVTATVDPGLANGTNLTNTASVDLTDIFANNYAPATAQDTDTVAAIVPRPDLAISKDDGTATYTPGGTLTYTIIVTNVGNADANAADPTTVTDTFPPELVNPTWTCAPSAGAACTAGPVAGNINDTVTIPVGGSLTYTVTATVDPAATGDIVNTATVSNPNDTNTANNSARDTDSPESVAAPVVAAPTAVPAVAPAPAQATSLILVDPSVVKLGDPQNVLPGEVMVWTIIVTNNGTGTATGVVITDPVDTSFFAEILDTTTSKGTVTVAGLNVTFDIGTLASGESVTMTITVRVRDDVRPPATGLNTVSFNANELEAQGRSATASSTVELLSLPPTGYPPADSAPGGEAAWIGFGLAGLSALVVAVVWRRRWQT